MGEAAQMTLAELVAVLRECAGTPEGPGTGAGAGIGGDSGEDLAGLADVAFEELGYDSLALIEMSARVRQERGIELTDEQISGMTTPRVALEFINGASVRKGA